MPIELALQLRRAEERLERLLVSGWRNAGAEAAELAESAAAFDELGLGGLASRLRAVGAAPDGADALRSITLAATACRLLRARLPADTTPAGDWAPLEPAPKRRATSTERVLPIGRMVLSDGEAWACVRLRADDLADDWLLLDPLPTPASAERASPSSPGLVGRLLGRSQEASGNAGNAAPWMYAPIEGVLRWRGRYALGASSEVQRCAMIEPVWPASPAQGEAFAMLRKVLGGSLRDGRAVLGYSLRIKQLDPNETSGYLWPDAAAASAFRSGVSSPVWALAWVQGETIAPLVLVEPGGALRKPRLAHLVPGLPGESLRI